MKYLKLIFFFLLFCVSLQAEMVPALMSCYEGISEGKIADHIDVITGQFVDAEVDLYIAGPDPLILQRNYESADFATSKSPGNWRLLSHCFLIAGEDGAGKGCLVGGERHLQHHVYAGERLGDFLWYSGWRNIQKPKSCALKLSSKEHLKGITNCAREEITARTFVRNNQMTFRQEEECYEILSGNGALRIYRSSKIPSHSLFAGSLLQIFASSLNNPKFYHLEEEILPSGNRILYAYNDNGNPLSISAVTSKETKPFSTITFEYFNNDVYAMADDGRKVIYHLLSNRLEKVERSDQPEIAYTYDLNTTRLIKKSYPNGSFLQVIYDAEGRVNALKDPDGQQASFCYSANSTNVTFPSGVLREYRYDSNKRLTFLDTYTSQRTLHQRQHWEWEKEGIKNGLLQFKTIEDALGNIYLCETYRYDERGNLLEEFFCGNLTGKSQEPIHYKSDGTPDLEGRECHKKTYVYSTDKYNLLVKQGDCKGNEIVFAYKPNTNLLVAKCLLEKGNVRKRFFYNYNSSGVCIQEIEDDGSSQDPKKIWGWGVSCRHLTETIPNEKGFPLVIKKTYRSLFIKDRPYSTTNADEEFLFCKLVNTFDGCGRLTRQETFDTKGNFKFAIERTYDTKGNLTSERDPLGQTIFYTYDSCNQKLTEHHPHRNKLIQYKYDLKGRLIATQETLGNLSFVSQTHFDSVGNKIAISDRYGNRIDYQYDSLGRLIEAIYPFVFNEKQIAMRPSFHYSYDLFGNCIEITDPKGYVTKKAYNARNQPTRIDYPDGSYELSKYDTEGSLHRQSTRDQTIHVFEYDYLARLIKKEHSTYNPNGHGEWISTVFNDYNAFHKIRSKNEEGYTILYQYDGAGRLISEIKPTNRNATEEDKESHKKEFIYDTLNRVAAVKTWYGQGASDFAITIKEYDFLGFTVEERGEDAAGIHYWKKGYVYDPSGNLTQKIAYVDNKPFVETETSFDSLNNPIAFTDGYGRSYEVQNDYTYLNSLGQKVLKKTLFDPIGRKMEMV